MATNRIDILDAALLRPGRIDRKIEFPPPNEAARLDILKIHSRRMNLTRGIQLRKIAEQMPGASGAEVKGVCTEAGMYALRERRIHVNQEDFEMAVSKVLLLLFSRSRVSLFSSAQFTGSQEGLGAEHEYPKTLQVDGKALFVFYSVSRSRFPL